MRASKKTKPKTLMCMFPRWDPKRLWLYLVGGNDGSIKVGITCDLRGRIKTHRLALKARFDWVHTFAAPLEVNARTCEAIAKRRFKSIGRQVGRSETFFGLTKSVAIAEVRTIIANEAASEDRRMAAMEADRKEDAAWSEFRKQYMATLATAKA